MADKKSNTKGGTKGKDGSTSGRPERKEIIDNGQVIGRAKAQASGMAVVKSVESGDQIVVMGGCAPGQIPPAKRITLSGIMTPRLARGKSSTDEPFAWHAREHLRNLCIGQTVFFSVNYVHSSGREYADVFVGKHRTNLAHEMVRAGWAKVMTNKDGSVHAEKQDLYDMMEQAQNRGVGMWKANLDEKDFVRKVDWHGETNAWSLYQQYKGQSINAMVEYVRDGSQVRVALLGHNGTKSMDHVVVPLFLAGVQCPDTPPPFKFLMDQWKDKKEKNPDLKTPAPKREKPEPFALEAKQFVEARLLHRVCKVQFAAVDNFNNLFGTVLLPQGNVASRLLETGLAKMVEWTVMRSPDMAKFTALEGKAKARKLGVWKNWTEDEPKIPLPAGFTGKVVFVNSGDSVTVSDGKVDHKLSLASVRAPRSSRGRKDEDWAFESREYIRKKLVGKRVKVEYEYARTAPKDARDKSARFFVTLFQGPANVGVQLLGAGLATVNRHRRDEARSKYFEDLVGAEKKAQAKKEHIHSGKKPPARLIVDLSYRPRKSDQTADAEEVVTSKASGFFTQLQNVRELRGVVEHVFSCTRFKVLLPSENVIITLLLSGCRIPSQEDDKDGQWAKSALDMVKDKCLQQDVVIQVEDMSRDNFVGLLSTKSGLSINCELLRSGLVDMFRFSAEKSKSVDSLKKARDEAKTAKRNFWHNWEEKQAAYKAAREAAEKASGDAEAKVQGAKVREGETISVSVTEVVDAANFYVTVAGAKSAEAVEKAMAAYNAKQSAKEEGTFEEEDLDEAHTGDEDWDITDETNPVYYPPRYGTVAGLYEDGSWHRVKIEGGNAEKGWKVQFIDFGNYDTLPALSVRPLAPDTAKLPSLAKLCTLTSCQAPPRKSEHFVPAGDAFTDYSFEKKLVGRVDMIDRDEKFHLTLRDAEPADGVEGSINSWMLRDGWCRIGKPSSKTYALTETYRKDEDFAKREHTGIWEYGDVSDGEDENFREKDMWKPRIGSEAEALKKEKDAKEAEKARLKKAK